MSVPVRQECPDANLLPVFVLARALRLLAWLIALLACLLKPS